MTNAEKYKDAIIAQLCKTGNLAVDRTGKIMSCALDNCAVCTFSSTKDVCLNEKQKWLNAEADEKKVFSEKDKALIKGLDKINWVVRDKDGDVYGYETKPRKNSRDSSCWSCFPPSSGAVEFKRVSTAEFAPVKWEDDEPTSRAEILGEEETEK